MTKTLRKKLRAAIYCRVSKQDMTNPEFCSLDGQEGSCRAQATARGWDVTGVFRDASTGSNTDRPKLQELRELVARGGCEVVAVYKFDRLSRSVADFWAVVKEMHSHDCALVSVTESFDSSTPTGKMVVGILSVFAEFEREQIVARTKQGLGSRAAAGYWPIRWAPFGYDKVRQADGLPVTLKANSDAPWVRMAYQRYLDGDGCQLIADHLNEQGLRTPNGKEWDGRAVRRLLGSVVYAGQVPWNGQAYDGKHPGVVDADVWAAVQERLATGQRGQSKKPRTLPYEEAKMALLGLVRDANGEPFRRYWATGRDGRTRYYYYQDPKSGKLLNAGAFDREILRALRATILDPDIFAETVDGARQEVARMQAELDEREQRLTDELAALERQEGRLIDAVADGLDAKAVKKKLAALARVREAAEAKLERIAGEREDVKTTSQDVTTFAELRVFLGAVDDSGRFVDVAEVLRGIVRCVTVDIPSGKLYTSLKVPYVPVQSKRGNVETTTATPDNARNVAVSPEAASAFSKSGYGEGDGTRTHNHQIDSLVL